MKKLLSGFILLTCLMAFCGCSKKFYNNQQVLQSFQTKAAVANRFGQPGFKRKNGGLEEWTYDLNNTPAVVSAKKRDTIKALYFTVPMDSLHKNQLARNDKYIKFMFDSAGNVTGYKINAVNLTRVKKDSFGIGLLKVLGIAAAITVVIGVEIANNGADISW
jgi:hypothetical protein